MAMIEIKDLWKSFNGKTVLKGLNLNIEEGETLVILGRSGAGKSVLLRMILGLEKPDKGELYVNGINTIPLLKNKLYEAVSSIGMLFQGSALFDSMTIGENTSFYLKEHPHAFNDGEIHSRVQEALRLVGLEGTEKLLPADLSGGMRKRAALARLIVYRPKVLLYDEPTTGLDPITAMQINDLIVKTQKELKGTSVVVTHDIASAFHVADRIALNHDGKILYISKKDEFYKIKDPLVQSFLKNSLPVGLN